MTDVYAGSIDAPAPNRSEEMETAVLTEIMMGGRKSYEILAAEIDGDDFCNPQNRRLFEILRQCAEEASPDAVCFFPAVVRNHCDPNRADDRLLAGETLKDSRIAEVFAAPHSYTVSQSVQIAKHLHLLTVKRRLADFGMAVARMSESSGSAPELLHKAQEELARLLEMVDTGADPVTFAEVIKTVLEKTQERNAMKAAGKDPAALTGLSTGFPSIDRMTGGLKGGQLIIIAARPAMGKSVFGMNIVRNICKLPEFREPEKKEEEKPAATPAPAEPQSDFDTLKALAALVESHRKTGKWCAVFSLEMSSEQVATRLLAAEANINVSALSKADITQADTPRLLAGTQSLSRCHIVIDDTASLSLAALKSRIRRIANERNIGCILVDYLGLIDAGTGDSNMAYAIGRISRALKVLAKEMDIPVLLLVQLSRKVEEREDHHPQLADLRDSGSIEQDADVVMMIYREEVYKPEANNHGRAEILLRKVRQGETGTVPCTFSGEFQRFEEDTSAPADRTKEYNKAQDKKFARQESKVKY